jgi:glycosyltransferase involved in cell wall biosynthesis
VEVIAVNDGSTDNTLKILKDIAKKDHRVKIIDKINEGVSCARRDGLKAAKGHYICFVDSDDYIPEGALETLYSHILKENVDIVIGQCIRKIGPFTKKTYKRNKYCERRITLPELWDQLYISFMGVNILPVQVWGKLYKKDVIDDAINHSNLFSDKVQSLGEDEYFNLMLHPFVKSIFFTNKFVYVYRYGGITSKYNKNLKELYEMSDIRLKLLDKYKYMKGYPSLFIEYKNCIFSDILQRMEYLKENKNQIFSFLDYELGKRETYKRMIDYYNGVGPNVEINALITRDYEKIWSIASSRFENGRKRRVMKKLLMIATNSFGKWIW